MTLGYFSFITSAWKEPQGAKMTQVKCVRSTHGNTYFQISLCCECQSNGRVTRFGASHRSCCVHELPARPRDHTQLESLCMLRSSQVECETCPCVAIVADPAG